MADDVVEIDFCGLRARSNEPIARITVEVYRVPGRGSGWMYDASLASNGTGDPTDLDILTAAADALEHKAAAWRRRIAGDIDPDTVVITEGP